MHSHRPGWIQIGANVLFILMLSACVRSASDVMTPLPSVPPPTPTNISTTPALSPTKPALAAATSTLASTATFSPTETPRVETATATLASLSTTVACGNALPTRLQVGSFAYVNPDPPLPNNLRSDAGEDNTLVGVIQPGQAVKIMAGPKCINGSNWWQVSPLQSDAVGWTAEGDAQNYWLLPCASEKECGS